MPKFTYNSTISLGNILSILSMVLMVSAGYGAVKDQLATDRADINGQERRIASLEALRAQRDVAESDQRVAINSRLTGLETNMLTLLQAVQDLRHSTRP